MRVAVYCADCYERLDLPAPEKTPDGEAACSKGHGAIAFRHADGVTAGGRVERCSRCERTAFFSQKDFDQRLGCAILLLGALAAAGASALFGGIWFVPVLLAFVVLDRVVARRVPYVVVCYRCDTEYRDVPGAASYKPYDPHVAERDAELKTVRRMAP